MLLFSVSNILVGCTTTYSTKYLEFKYNEETDDYTVLGYKHNISSNHKKSVIIPPTYNDKNVTRIADNAFANAFQYQDDKKISKIELPDTITSIGEYAFHGTYVTDLTIPNSVTYIGFSAFCANIELTSVTLSNSLTTMERCLFFWCKNLRSLDIPRSVQEIKLSNVDGCKQLNTINIPSSVLYMEEDALTRCSLSEYQDEYVPLIINCEASSKPEGWDDNWITDEATINWGVQLSY